MISELVSRLPEVYQTIFDHPELSTAVSRNCEDRLRHITEVYRLLEKRIGRPLRVLDLGCAQGFFSLSLAQMGASVLGVDYLAENIAVCQALAGEHPGFDIRFVTDRAEEVLTRLEVDEYDLVLGLSVFHHIVHSRGVDAVRGMLAGLARKVALGVFELALREEPLYWGMSQAEEPRDLLDGFVFVHELARHSTHLSEIARPLFVASQRCWILDGQIGFFDKWATDSHQLAPGAHQGSRRYFFGEQRVIKWSRLDHSQRGALNTAEFRAEAAFLQSPPPGFSAPGLILYGEIPQEAWLIREALPGELLLDQIVACRAYDAKRVIRDVLTQLVALERVGLFHSDVRTWNVLLDHEGGARLIDYGAIGTTPRDCAWPYDIFLSFLVFVWEVSEASAGGIDPLRKASISPYRLRSPYRQWGERFWSLPAEQWTFLRMLQEFSLLDEGREDLLSQESSSLQRWMMAIEESTDVQTWYAHCLDRRQVRMEQSSKLRAQQLEMNQEQLAAVQVKLQVDQEQLAAVGSKLQADQEQLARVQSQQGGTQSELLEHHLKLLAMQDALRTEWALARSQWQAEWLAAQRRIDELQHLAQQSWVMAEQRNCELQDIRASYSWRITHPLRQAVRPFLMAKKSFRLTVTSFFARILRRMLANPRLRALVLHALERFPRLKQWLTGLVLLVVSHDVSGSTAQRNVASGEGVSTESSMQLSPRATRIYTALKYAIAKRNS